MTEQVSNARTIEQLGGGFTNVGASADLVVGVSGSGFWGDVCGAPGGKVIGGEAGVSVGAGGWVHAQETYTVTWSYVKFNPIGFIEFLGGAFQMRFVGGLNRADSRFFRYVSRGNLAALELGQYEVSVTLGGHFSILFDGPFVWTTAELEFNPQPRKVNPYVGLRRRGEDC